MRPLVCAVLCCIYTICLFSTTALAQGDKSSPQIAEDTLAPQISPATTRSPAPHFPPVVNKSVGHESSGALSLKIAVNYPEIGIPSIDSHIAQWATNVAHNFQENISRESHPDDKTAYELLGKYSVSRPSAAAVSISYEIWTYTGGAHGNLDIITLNYDTEHGEQLTLDHIFNDVEQALELMSTYCYTVLAAELAAELGPENSIHMLKSGTSPDTENFAAISLHPQGIVVHFQPYQVAPWSAGPQKVTMSLADIADAKPQLELWGIKEKGKLPETPVFTPPLREK